jgi:aminopeptidase N
MQATEAAPAGPRRRRGPRVTIGAAVVASTLALALLAGAGPVPARATTPVEALEEAARWAEDPPPPPRTTDPVTEPGGDTAGGQPEPRATAAASSIVPGRVDRASIRMTATYAIGARLRLAARALGGHVTITARNDSGDGVDRVRLNTVMGPLGRLDLGAVTVDGERVRPVLRDQTITVPLGGVLPPGESATIRVEFSATLRSTTGGSSWLFTRANGVTSLYRWVPWISRGTPFDRPNHGDPFVTPVSPSVSLRLRTDRRVRVVVNGTRTSISDDGLVTTWTLANVRDVVVNAAADYRTARQDVGDTEVRVHVRPGQPRAAILAEAVRALRRLEDRLGPYPWPVLRIVGSSGGYGMEGPGIVWIPAGVPSANLRYLVTHEIAHQWFYGLVGNDQADEPFADEAMADMVARYVTDTRRGSRCTTGRLDRSIYDYSAACYYERIYIQGGNLLDRTRRQVGTGTFFATLRRYLDDHRWELVHTRTLLDALDDATSRDLADEWRSRFPSLY